MVTLLRIVIGCAFMFTGTQFALAGLLIGSPTRVFAQEETDWMLIGPDEPVMSVAVSPSFDVDSTIFVGTSIKVLKSVDAGATWADIGTDLKPRFPSAPPSPVDQNWVIRVSPAYATDRTIVAVGTASGFISENGGACWREFATGAMVCPTCPRFIDAQFSPDYASDGMLMLASASGGGLFRFLDRAHRVDLVPVSGGMRSAVQDGVAGGLVSVAFSPSYAIDRTVFAGSQDGMFKSTDGGATWADLRIQAKLNSTGFFYVPSVSPDGSTLIVGAQGGTLRSTDGGESWQVIGKSPCPSHSGTLFDPDFADNGIVFAFASCPNGVWSSQDSGQTWEEAMSADTWAEVHPVPLAVHVQAAWLPGNPRVLLVPSRRGLRAHVQGAVPGT
jgi:photosystem II stability/assembly factor-like uncharacterized protein